MTQVANNKQQPVILYTDDDVASVLMAEAAQSAAGYKVLMAHNGFDSVVMFNEHLPDLIIMDAVMPGDMDGFDAIRMIRQSPEGKHTPIMMVTGLDDYQSIASAFEFGATDFLTKPINFHVLPHRVNYMLRSAEVANELRTSQNRLNDAQRIAGIGSWEVEPASGTVGLSDECKRLLGFNKEKSVENLHQAFRYLDRSVVKQILEKYQAAVDDGTSFNHEFQMRHQSEQRELTLRVQAISQIDKNQKRNIIGTLQDVTEIFNAQKQIHNLAYYDVVTGLPNRAYLNEKLSYALALAKRSGRKFALLFLDLDHFKQVNDTLGHDAGDELLQQTADRLNEAVREYDAVIRPVSFQKTGENVLQSMITL